MKIPSGKFILKKKRNPLFVKSRNRTTILLWLRYHPLCTISYVLKFLQKKKTLFWQYHPHGLYRNTHVVFFLFLLFFVLLYKNVYEFLLKENEFFFLESKCGNGLEYAYMFIDERHIFLLDFMNYSYLILLSNYIRYCMKVFSALCGNGMRTFGISCWVFKIYINLSTK